MQMPCTAHTTGFHTCRPFGASKAPGSTWFHTISGCPKDSCTSRPALNARSPAARTTTACTESSSLTACQTCEISSHIARLNTLSRSGRFNVIVATCDSGSTS